MADIELEGWPEPARVVISMMSRRKRRAMASSCSGAGRPARAAEAGSADAGAAAATTPCAMMLLACLLPASIAFGKMAQDSCLDLFWGQPIGAQTEVGVAPCIGQPAALLTR